MFSMNTVSGSRIYVAMGLQDGSKNSYGGLEIAPGRANEDPIRSQDGLRESICPKTGGLWRPQGEVQERTQEGPSATTTNRKSY